MHYVIPSFDVPSVPVVGDDRPFPVRHIYCVGRNYAEHAREMGGDATKEPPFFFTKFADAIVPVVPAAIGRIAYPMATRNLHHELELVVALGIGGADVPAADAGELVFGYAVGLDMTRRDLQNEMREKKRPWDIGKSFAQAAPIAPIHPVATIGVLSRGEVTLLVNGERRQHGDLSDMIWDVPHVIEFLSKLYRLEPGDLIFTGTPSGVGPVVVGDRLEGHIDGLTPLQIEIVAASP
ncbi:MAG TPA: fumarylacetoacetate hydrolase family protein [Casimicrobiaceae bacterium]|nr:fumarylacetoacetate hydrolase family protein [Casimicrobiaceae bacterium]